MTIVLALFVLFFLIVFVKAVKIVPQKQVKIIERLGRYHRTAEAGLNTIVPFLDSVRDTIDLCPGDCGTSLEQIATVPMSQFEATGIAGDVPFTVEFPAPAGTLTLPGAVPPLAPPAAPKKTP